MKYLFSLLILLFGVLNVSANDVQIEGVDNPSAIVSSDFIFTEAPFASCHASTIAETHNGVLVASWFGGTKEGAGDVAIWAASFDRKIQKWEAPRLVGDAPEENTPCWNPVLFQPSKGPLCLFYKHSKQIADWKGILLTSNDDGKNWVKFRDLPESFIGPVKNKPVELAEGTILCPSSTEHDGWRVHFELIPALDKTWSKTEAINEKGDYQAIQPTVFIYNDGRMQAICRNRDGNGNLLQTWSEDFGKTWSKLTPTELPNPCSGVDGVTLSDGRQLLVYNHTNVKTGGRNVLNVACSSDGIHWNAVCVLENSPGEYSYPAVIQTQDGLVHIVYTWRRQRIRHVTLDPQKIQEVPIVNGKWPESVK